MWSRHSWLIRQCLADTEFPAAMHFAQRTYVLLMLTAVLAVAGIWSSDPSLSDLWRIPAVLLLTGLAYEGFFIRRAVVTADIETAPRAFLGREQTGAFGFKN